MFVVILVDKLIFLLHCDNHVTPVHKTRLLSVLSISDKLAMDFHVLSVIFEQYLILNSDFDPSYSDNDMYRDETKGWWDYEISGSL